MTEPADPFSGFLNGLLADEPNDEHNAALRAARLRKQESQSIFLPVMEAIIFTMDRGLAQLTPHQRQIAYAVADLAHPLGDGMVDWEAQNMMVERTARFIGAALLVEQDLRDRERDVGPLLRSDSGGGDIED